MIQKNTIDAVYPLADLLADRGYLVRPLATTPVAQLVQAGHFDLPPGANSEEGYDPEETLIQGSTHRGPDGVVRHDIVMDELVEVIAESVKGNLHVARNVVNPIIKETVADLQEHMQIAENQLQASIGVVVDFWSDVWNSPTLDAMVDRYNETPYREVQLLHEIPLNGEFSIEDELFTGSASFDELVQDAVENFGVEQVMRVRAHVFGGVGVRQGVLGNVLRDAHPIEVLVIHLMARRLIGNPPEGTTISLSQYDAYMATLIAQTGRQLNQIRQKRLRAQNQDLLVTEWPMGRETVGRRKIEIHVNGDLYSRFLEAGGSPEVVIGSFITDQIRQSKVMLEQKDRLERAWEKQHRILVTGQRLNRFNHGVEGLRQAVARQINEMDDDILPVERAILHRKLEENLSSLYGHWYERPYEYARKVICDTIFPHTMALQILCAIDHVCDDHEGIEVREAALLATIEIVSSWVAKLCVVERVDT